MKLMLNTMLESMAEVIEQNVIRASEWNSCLNITIPFFPNIHLLVKLTGMHVELVYMRSF